MEHRHEDIFSLPVCADCYMVLLQKNGLDKKAVDFLPSIFVSQSPTIFPKKSTRIHGTNGIFTY